MDNLSHGRVIGIDVGRDWLDVHCLPDGHRCRLPNARAGHVAVAELARNRDATVCFESTGGQEWQLWALLEAEGVSARQVPPAQVKAFAQSRGTRAKTDRIDAELIARFFAFRPEAGRSLPAEKLRILRALTSKRAQVVEMRKRLLAQVRAHQKLGTAAMFEDIDTELKQRFDSLIKELEGRITRAIAGDDHLSEMTIVLRSIPGIGPVASTMLIAEMPEIGTITGEEAAALTGLAPVAHDSGTLRGKRAIAGGRRALRHVMFQAALVAGTSQPKPESLRRSPPQGRQTAHGYHHRRRQKARHHCERPVQEPPEMDRHDGLTDTVARGVGD
jgi:transposase